jgi:predicted dinucleotide-binding enzyme
MGTMRILDKTGDTTMEWAVDDDEATARAKRLFEQLIGQRQMAFGRRAADRIEQAERLYSFNPELEEILWVRPIQGG